MNNAKMWLVVPPAVGVPIFLGAVAVGSFAVHVAVLSKVSWYDDYVKGMELGSGDQAALKQQQNGVAKASYAVELPNGEKEVTVTMPDGTVATAILKPDVVLASTQKVTLDN